MHLTFGDLFCGAGGLSLGARQASFMSDAAGKLAPAWAIDSDPDACATYRLNIHDNSPVADVRCADVRGVAAPSLAPVDILLFGFPCNDFSAVGKRRGMRGQYAPLYLEAVRILRTLRPMAFVAENVAGLTSSHEGRCLHQAVHDFRQSGYRVCAHQYRLEEYGLPQARRRIFLVGIRKDLRRDFRPPAPFTDPPVTVREALSRPYAVFLWNAEPPTVSETVAERLSHIRPGENIWRAQRRPDFPDHLRLKESACRIQSIYRRLDPDRPAWTVTARGGGGTRTYHWSENRPLTNRELARLQGFPDDFRFIGGIQSVRSQIGMAVPPPAGRVIIDALLKTLAGVAYETVEPNLLLPERAPIIGRPRRLEAKSTAERTKAHRQRRTEEHRAVIKAVERAVRAGLANHLPPEDRRLLQRYLKRTTGETPDVAPLPLAAE